MFLVTSKQMTEHPCEIIPKGLEKITSSLELFLPPIHGNYSFVWKDGEELRLVGGGEGPIARGTMVKGVAVVEATKATAVRSVNDPILMVSAVV